MRGLLRIRDLDLSRLVEAGRTVTVIISDGRFEVPDTLPGGAATLASKQHTFTDDAWIKMRVLTRA